MIDSRATEQTFEDATRAYIVAALWTSIGRDDMPLDDAYDASDLAPETAEAMRADVVDFLELCWREDLDLGALEADQIGHDFWLTRNGHGAGFWDRGLGDLGDRLTELCRPYGEAYLYVGDDGQIHTQ